MSQEKGIEKVDGLINLGDRISSYASETTLHGISHVAKRSSSWLRRLIWLALFLGFLGYFGWIMTSRFLHYYAFPVATRLQVVNRKPMEFPAVTFCNYNQLRKSYVESDEFIHNMVLASNPHTFHLSNFNISDPQLLEKANAVDIAEMIFNGSHLLQNAFNRCRWKSQPIHCSDYFTPTYTDMGLCYTFNSAEFAKKNGRLSVSRTGKNNALQLYINVEQYEYYFQDGYAAGVKMLVHNPNTPPLTDELGFAAGPGTEVFVALREVRAKKLPAPYEGSHCIDTNDPNYVNPLAYYDIYSRASCRLECLVNYTVHIKNCMCNQQFVRGGGYPVCNFTSMLYCADPAYEEYITNDEIEEECGCRETCDETYYEVSKSEARFPSNKRSAELQHSLNTTDSHLRENLLSMNIYFEDLSYTIIEDIPAYTLDDLQADIGGNLGLCLGASFLSVVEFGEFVLFFFIAICQRVHRIGKVSIKSTIKQAW